ncbi:MAG: outer membrane protein-like protein [Chitinophagaceae bacterium]|nr:outer membrane protein-like protein [Chitinophagaceae bacterium]
MLSRFKTLFLLIFSASFLAVACNNGDNTNNNNDSTVSPTDKAENKNDSLPDSLESDASYLVKVTNAGYKEIAASRMALKNATLKEVKAFANMMIADHTKMGAEVKALAKKKNIAVPDSLDHDKAEEIRNNTKKGIDFDRDYMDQMVSDHKDAQDLFQKASDKSNDPDVKKLFSDGLPKIQHHLQEAQATQDKAKNAKDDNKKQ